MDNSAGSSEGKVVRIGRAPATVIGRFQADGSIRLDFSVSVRPGRLDAIIEENVVRIARRAVSNAIQHSG